MNSRAPTGACVFVCVAEYYDMMKSVECTIFFFFFFYRVTMGRYNYYVWAGD